MSYTKEQLRDIFRKPFNAEVWKNILLDFFQAKEIRTTPQDLELENTSDKGFYLGKDTTSEGLALGFFLFEINSGDVLRKRVGLRNLVKPFLKYDVDAAIAVFNDNKHWRLSFITDFGSTKTAPKRFTYVFGDSAQYYNTPVKRLFDLQSKDISVKNLYDTFSVEALTKEFYNELANWYAWATKVIQFPNALEDASDDQKYNAESGIRLVTRLIFIWFLKEKKLVPEEFFDPRKVSQLLKDFDPSKKAGLFDQYVLDSKYYQAILQNLFFAMLNCPIMEDGTSLRGFRKYDEDGKATATGRGDSRLMRYKDYFADPDAFLQLAQKVPFLNGGLFDCLDDPDNKFYLDGFSDNKEIRKTLCVPDFLFFGENNDIDLSEWFDDRQKKHINVRGIIDILKSYQFTIEENTPYEQEVALDPELLGKVFENLLASYNPETKTTARKSTGSYYTPREIVQYMVNESLVAYLKEQVDESLEQQYRQLLDYNDTEGQISLSLEQKKSIMSALYHCKVLDPACGSGAFPMGILQQMVHVLSKLDADNTIWKNVIETKLGQELANTIGHTDEERRDLQNDINRNFDLSQNAPDYARKLYLIENCIYGIDIQTIAIQISKLRCFISLVVDQKVNDSPEDNYGIRPLPNLEARFVAANSLIGLRNDLSLANTEAVQKVREELADANHRIFNAKTLKTKRKWRSKVKDLRDALVEELKQTGFVTDDDASLIASWDPFNQNCSSRFFDPEWMFGFKKFDIVIGNPPYINANELKKQFGVEKYNKFKRNFVTAKGTVDFYVYFFEKGISLLRNNGCLAFITPNKFLCANYAVALRNYFIENTMFISFWDVSDTQCFSASVYPIVSILRKCSKHEKYIFQIKTRNKTCISYDSESLTNLPENIWGFILSDKINIVDKIICNSIKITDVCSINATSTANEADKFHSFIKDSGDGYKMINTGTIDPYISLWGSKPLVDKGCKFLKPYIINDVTVLGEYRFCMYKSPKIILAKMANRIEGFYDKDGEYASINTNCLHSIKVNPAILLAWIHSKVFNFIYEVFFDGLRMAGGYLPYSAPYLSCMYYPIFEERYESELISLVDCILSAKKANPQADTSEWEKEIDKLVYELYGLTEEEIRIVEGKN